MRSYERREKQTKKTVRSEGEPLMNSDMYVLAARTEQQSDCNDIISFFEDSSDDCKAFLSTESTSDDDNDPPYRLHRHPTTALAPHGPDGQQCEDYVEQKSG